MVGNVATSAAVSISVRDTQPPTVSITSPASGVTVTEWVTVTACAGTGYSTCDSGSLLVGRGAMGPAFNAPNTLAGSCADGSSGGFHSDESLDALKVSTLDGTALAAGKQVRVEAKVWAWGGGDSDTLELYYTANAASPTWTYLTTLVPTAGGQQFLSTTYTLPNGSLQAIRGVFSYGGTKSSSGWVPRFESFDTILGASSAYSGSM